MSRNVTYYLLLVTYVWGRKGCEKRHLTHFWYLVTLPFEENAESIATIAGEEKGKRIAMN